MRSVIDGAFSRNRTTLLLLAGLLVVGLMNFASVPREAEPAINFPMIFVNAYHDGISPLDAERLIIRPLEAELQSLEALKELRSEARESHAMVMLEFEPGFDSNLAMNDVREKVDLARAKLPQDTEEPVISEMTTSLMPVISIVLSGSLPEARMVRLANQLKDRIKSMPDVIDVSVRGQREEVVDIVVDPVIMETYGVSYEELFSLVQRNNRLVAAGAMDSGVGRLTLKVPGVIEDVQDVLALPIKVSGDKVVTVADVARVELTFKDATDFARIDGEPNMSLEVAKRSGASVIETTQAIRRLVEAESKSWPEGVKANFMMDKGITIKQTSDNLQNGIITAMLLVMLLVLAVMGLRPALLVGAAIPGSYLVGILILSSFGITMNFVTMFGLVVSAGLLVDGAIVVVELADRYRVAGLPPREAYRRAAKRMAWPIISSTATTLAVFVPLIVLPGMLGQFMRYLPMTVTACLSASLLMALVFIPVLGASISRRKGAQAAAEITDIDELEKDRPASGVAAAYAWLLERLLPRPLLVLAAGIGILVGSFMIYGKYGKGLEFFPEREPEFAMVIIHARGDLALAERDVLVTAVEDRIRDIPGSKHLNSNTASGHFMMQELPEDTIGTILVQFDDWYKRRAAVDIVEDIRYATNDVAGVKVSARLLQDGPQNEKPIWIQVSSAFPDLLEPAVSQVRQLMSEQGTFVDVEDNRPLPGNEWRLTVDRTEAARYGADISVLGNAVQLISHGIKIAEYRPDEVINEVDIRVRFPEQDRSIDQLNRLTVSTPRGMVPIANFVQWEPAPRTAVVRRVAGQRSFTIKADVLAGELANTEVNILRERLQQVDIDPRVSITFRGELEEQARVVGFFMKAVMASLLMMAVILVTQFNSIYQALLVLSSVIFSTAGVLLGLVLVQKPFGVVMCGIGLIALAGIVVNNNIILIDTYNVIKRSGLSPIEAAICTGTQRLRPVILTSVTTICGLLPMVLEVNVNILGRTLAFGDPSIQWWTMISSTIAGGLAFATLLTLILTPTMLVFGDTVADRIRALFNRKPLQSLEQPS